MQAVTYIDEQKSVRTYTLEGIEKFGCSQELVSRLRYAKTMAEKLVEKNTKSAVSKPAPPIASSVPMHA